MPVSFSGLVTPILFAALAAIFLVTGVPLAWYCGRYSRRGMASRSLRAAAARQGFGVAIALLALAFLFGAFTFGVEPPATGESAFTEPKIYFPLILGAIFALFLFRLSAWRNRIRVTLVKDDEAA